MRSTLNAIISEITAAMYAGYYEVTEKADLDGCTCNQIWYISESCMIPFSGYSKLEQYHYISGLCLCT